jgi:hypothetical protein
MPFVDMVFDEPTRNAAWGILSIGKYDLSLWISFTLLISNIIHTYETLSNKMARLTTECAAQQIQCSCYCKGNLTDLRRELHLSLAKGNPKRML